MICDEGMKLRGVDSGKWYGEEVRMVRYEEYGRSKVYRFVSKKMEYEGVSICELYRERWKVEV